MHAEAVPKVLSAWVLTDFGLLFYLSNLILHCCNKSTCHIMYRLQNQSCDS